MKIHAPLTSSPHRIFQFIFAVFLVLYYMTAVAQAQSDSQLELKRKGYDRAVKATVKITARDGGVNGSGVIIRFRSNGIAAILTAAHVVAQEYCADCVLEFFEDITVQVQGQAGDIEAYVDPRYVNPENDLALVWTQSPLETRNVISYLPAKKIRENQRVAAFGFPKAAPDARPTVTGGYIERFQTPFLLSTNWIDEGNSGGALVNKKGCMVGMVRQQDEENGGALAVSIGVVESIVNDMLRGTQLDMKWSTKSCKPKWWLWSGLIPPVAYGICKVSGGCPDDGGSSFGLPFDPPSGGRIL